MKKALRKIGAILPTKVMLYIDNFRTYKRVLNLKNPKYYGEKIQWIKLYGEVEKLSPLVDKYLVRDYVEEKIGSEYLPTIYRTYKNVDEINYDELPEKFVLKLNNGSGGNIICRDKLSLDKKAANKKLKKLMNEDYYKYKKEFQYKNVKTLIICEEYLEDSRGSLIEYSLHCFDGKVQFIEVHTDRFSGYKENYYYPDWSQTGFRGKVKNYAYHIDKPENLEELIELSEKLSSGFTYVRVDFNAVDNKIYFGELTFTPSSGTERFYPLEKDLEIAQMIDISKYKIAIK